MLGGIVLAVVTTVTCAGVNDTADIQNALTAGDVKIEGTCVVPGQPGIQVGSNRIVEMYGATIFQGANKGGTGVLGRNRIFETVVGAENIIFRGGTLVGSRATVGGLQWSIGIMVDSAKDVVVDGVSFVDWYTDGIRVGGNPPGSTNVTIRNCHVSGAKRNAISLTSGTGLRLIGNRLEETNCNPAWRTAPAPVCTTAELNMPMCGIDFEPNPGESVSDVVVMDNEIVNNQKCGIFLQSNQFLGGQTLLFNNHCADNGTWCVAANQVTDAWVIGNKAQGGTIGYTFGAGLKGLVAVKNEVSGNSGNAYVFAGVTDPFADQNKTGGKPVFYVAIPSPVKMNGVEGTVQIRGFVD